LTRKEFTADKIIDREAEQELFFTLLQFADGARVLTVADAGGRGKSALLKRLEYNCLWVFKPQVAVTRIELDKLSDPSTHGLINAIRTDLIEISFPEYDKSIFLGVGVEADIATQQVPSLIGQVPMQGASVTGTANTFAGVIAPHSVFNIRGGAVRPEQEILLRTKSLEVFVKELIAITDGIPVVILFDAWERASPSLKEWIVNTLVRRCCFVKRGKLVIVIAGREIPDIPSTAESPVRSIQSLGEWTEKHVRDFLTLHFDDFAMSDEDIRFISGKIREGWALQTVLDLVQRWPTNVVPKR
jgi:hypothetical protein